MACGEGAIRDYMGGSVTAGRHYRTTRARRLRRRRGRFFRAAGYGQLVVETASRERALYGRATDRAGSAGVRFEDDEQLGGRTKRASTVKTVK